LPTSDEPTEQLPDQAVSKLNEGLKVCHKVMSEYRAALSAKPSPTATLQVEVSETPAEHG
jgi:hypothetical protein